MARTRTPKTIRKPKGEYHHGDLRRAVIQAAVAILGESGHASFTLREAARRIGVNHRALYRHFVDREAVLAAVAEDGYQRLVLETKLALGAAPAADARGRLLAIALAHVTFALREPAGYLVMTGPRLNEGGRFPELEPPIAEGFGLISAELRAGIARRELLELDITEATLMLFAAVHGLTTLLITRRVRARPEQLHAYVTRSIGHLLRGFERERT